MGLLHFYRPASSSVLLAFGLSAAFARALLYCMRELWLPVIPTRLDYGGLCICTLAGEIDNRNDISVYTAASNLSKLYSSAALGAIVGDARILPVQMHSGDACVTCTSVSPCGVTRSLCLGTTEKESGGMSGCGVGSGLPINSDGKLEGIGNHSRTLDI